MFVQLALQPFDMLQHLLQLLVTKTETEGDAVRLVLTTGEVVICRKDELAIRLAETDAGRDLLGKLSVDYHRFGQKTTVAHLLHKETGAAWVGVSICTQNFNRRHGQDLALRDAIRQFLMFEAYRNAFTTSEPETGSDI